MISRRILAAALILCALVAPSHAQKTKAQINSEITTNFPDNTSGQITPTGLRQVTNDIVNSIMPVAPVGSGNLPCFDGTTGLLRDCGSTLPSGLTIPSPSISNATLSGTNTAPTPSTADNSTTIATTAFVKLQTWLASAISYLAPGTGAVSVTLQQILGWWPVTPQMFGAQCNGSTDDSTALQATITAAAAGTTISVSGNCIYNTALDVRGKSYVTFSGTSRIGTAAQNSMLTYGGTAARAIDLRDTSGIKFYGVNLQWSSASFAGILLDYGSQTPGSNVSFYGYVGEASIQPTGSGSVTSVTCLNFSEAIEFVVERNSFNRCQFGIHGQNTLGQSTVGLIQKNQFFQTSNMPILECGESWSLISNTFEQRQDGKAAAFQNSTALPCKGMVSIGNWYGDVTVSGGSWFNQLTSQGFAAVGDRMSANNSGANLGYNLIGGSGYSFRSGSYEGMSIGWTCDGGTKPSGIRWDANTLTNITTPISGVANCLGSSAASNAPPFSITVPFASLPTCSASVEGTTASISDSSSATWGATITGGSTNHVFAFCNGTNWTVAGK